MFNEQITDIKKLAEKLDHLIDEYLAADDNPEAEDNHMIRIRKIMDDLKWLEV